MAVVSYLELVENISQFEKHVFALTLNVDKSDVPRQRGTWLCSASAVKYCPIKYIQISVYQQ